MSPSPGIAAPRASTSWTPSRLAAPPRHRLHRPVPDAPPRPETPIDETLRALDDLVRAGQGALRRLLELPRLAAGPGARPQRGARPGALRLGAAALQPPLPRDRARAAARCARRRASGVIAYNPLAGGFLSGKHSATAPPAAGTRFTLGTAGRRYQERYWHEREFEAVEALRPLAAEAGCRMAHAGRRLGARPPGHHLRHRRRQPARAARRHAGRRRQGAARRPQGSARRADPRVPVWRRSPMTWTES